MQNYLQEIPVINLINRQPLEPTRTLPSFLLSLWIFPTNLQLDIEVIQVLASISSLPL